jgi:hypothetical protein
MTTASSCPFSHLVINASGSEALPISSSELYSRVQQAVRDLRPAVKEPL